MKIEMENVNSYMFQNIEKFIKEKKLEGKKVILFGLNTSSYSTKKYLEKRGFKIYAYIDNDKKKVDETNDFLENVLPKHLSIEEYETITSKVIRAYFPEQLLSEYDENVAVLIASKYYDSMCEQLECMGYKKNVHILQTVNFYDLNHILNQKDFPDDMEEMDLKDVRLLQIQMLDFVDEICEKNHIRYYICGGTLLGAIRHKGYIPWDDDIDIAMPYNDYRKFLEIVKTDDRYLPFSIYDYPQACYQFFSRLVDKNTYLKSWEYPFLMTLGANIDIFPLFGLPDRQNDRNYFYNKIRNLNTRFVSSFIEEEEDTDEVLARRNKLREEIIAMMEEHDFDNCEWIGNVLSKYREKEIMPRNIYDSFVKVEFEGKKYRAASGYKEYLKTLFGNYMELPPETDRINTHNYKVLKK